MNKLNGITETVNGYERCLVITPAFDKRSPDPTQDFGIGSVMISMYLKNAKGVIQFIFSTGINLKHLRNKPLLLLGYDVGYHSPCPQYADQTLFTDNCPLLDGRKCYYDGSGLQAEEYMEVFISEGPDAVWLKMENLHKERFGNYDE